MKILVLGSGGREHALAWKIASSPLVDRVYCAPGNGGTAAVAKNVPLDLTDANAIYRYAKQNKMDLVVVGPEQPLCAGLADTLTKGGLRVFGPGARAARLEGSKVFAKNLMRKHAIPTADYSVFYDAPTAEDYLATARYPLVIKADGLAAGKGVKICDSRNSALEAVQEIMTDQRFGEAGSQILIEEALSGPEVSVHAICSKETIMVLEEACDYKRLNDGGEGPNTGGMGAFSPSMLLDDQTRAFIEEKVLVPTLHAMKRDDSPFRGLLYAGLMLTPSGPKVLEFNVRFGDPETQALLPRLKSDLVPLLLGSCDGTLDAQDLAWDPRPSVTVVVTSGGYPGTYQTGLPISGLAEAAAVPDVTIFHAGTARDDLGRIVTSGGRVLAITALGATRQEARERAYEAVDHIRFDGAAYRTVTASSS